MKSRFALLLLWGAVSLSCSFTDSPVADIKSVVKAPTPPILHISALYLLQSTDFPEHLTAVIVSEDCRDLSHVTQRQHDAVFELGLWVNKQVADQHCTAEQRYSQEHMIALPLEGLQAGFYTVRVHHLKETFELNKDQPRAQTHAQNG